MAIPIVYNLRSLRARWVSAIVAVLGIAGTVGVFLAVIGLARGFHATLVSSGSPGNALVRRAGSSSEMDGSVPLEQVHVLQDKPAIAREGGHHRATIRRIRREAGLLPEELVFNVDYLGGSMPTFALNFSRPGGEIIAQYYLFMRLGRGGYRRVYEVCAATAHYLAGEIAAMGPFELLYDGKGALPAVSYTLKDPATAGFSLYDLSEHLRIRGWQVPSYPLPANRQDTVIQRILIRHGIGRDEISLLLDDMRHSLARLTGPAPDDSMRRGYHH